jgi:hypothetical protein
MTTSSLSLFILYLTIICRSYNPNYVSHKSVSDTKLARLLEARFESARCKYNVSNGDIFNSPKKKEISSTLYPFKSRCKQIFRYQIITRLSETDKRETRLRASSLLLSWPQGTTTP